MKNIYRNGRPYLIDWFLLSTFLYLLFSFYLIINGKYKLLLSISGNNIPIQNSLKAVFIILVGIFGINLGSFVITQLSQKNSFNSGFSIITFTHKTAILLYSLALLLIMSKFLMLKYGIYGYGSSVIYTYGIFSFVKTLQDILEPFSLILLGYFLWIKKERSLYIKPFTFIIYFLSFSISLLVGMKENLILIIVYILVPFIYGGNKIKKRYIIIIVLLIIVIYPINSSYRKVYNSQQISRNVVLVAAINEIRRSSFKDVFQESIDSYKNRISLFPYLMDAISSEKNWTQYKNMNRYKFLPFAWGIPRFILKEKPRADIGTYYDTIFTGQSSLSRSSITPSTYGWAYFEGGIIYVFLIMLLFSVFINYLEFKINLTNPLHILIYTIALSSLLKVETDVYFLITGFIQMLFVNYIIYSLLFKLKI